jgi:hypothetical protein
MAFDAPTWWTSLRHGGLLIAPSRLAEHFPDSPAPLPQHFAEGLRRSLLRLDVDGKDAQAAVLDSVLHRVCGLETNDHAYWERGSEVDGKWSLRAISGEAVRPRRVWYGPHGAVLPVFWGDATRLGIGTGRRGISRVVHWLRQANLKLALVTNARQWRLIYAGLDFDAWAEWDSALWFEEGQPGPQVDALRVLLTPAALTPPKPDTLGPLLAAIQASRRGQAELSAELGERVRQAVEQLIQTHGPRLQALDDGVKPRDIYIAATRVVMRMVVALFAEARDLLPRDNAIYHGSYGLQGLREQLEHSGGGTETGRARLRERYGAWPRVLGLFRLVHTGSHHEQLPVPAYGGELFAPGESASPEPMRRALAVFEDAAHEHSPSDAVVFELLTKLCRSRVRVQQGKGSTWVDTPVDFSDLSSEYIGILYEGLLDYELRPASEPMVFLALGDEPLLPLSRLEAMEDDAIRPLVEKLKQKAKAASDGEEAEEEEDEEAGDEPDEEAVAADAALDEDETESDDARAAARARAHEWARRAVVAGKLVAKPKSKKAQAEYDADVDAVAKSLVRRVVLPGDWYLVRWGGTRKGAGTFYTRPQLAVPTVQRTLRPLAYVPPTGPEGTPNEDAPAAQWTPRLPEEILALKVCDPAVGSGSFLIGSLRFLTDALLESLHHHARIADRGDGAVVKLADGQAATRIEDELLPCRPDAEDFEARLRARLKRYVVERCLYGVDIDPLAAELARLSLWIETMDRELPFEFLDHKVKVGNSLVGCWFDRFRDYPALAWEREGGDKAHGNGTHFEKNAWTKALSAWSSNKVKPSLIAWILEQRSLLQPTDAASPEAIHAAAQGALQRIHDLGVQESEERGRLYRELIQENATFAALRRAFDTWCALWFWPVDRLDRAPLPRDFDRPSAEALEIVEKLRARFQFFHWELEFPDVFARPGAGFDAIVGNPPWEIQKPNSKEFFSNVDPLYRTYGKQQALRRQEELFEASADEERAWLEYLARFKGLSNWVKNAGEPFGDAEPENLLLGKKKADLHALWRSRRQARQGYADPEHPFRHQGSADVNTYKLFLEQAHALVRPGGQLGLIVPSGVYTDKGSSDLRALFLHHCHWRWLFGFENRDGIFDIHRSFKFGPVIVEKGGATDAIRTAFMRRNLADWEDAEAHAIPYTRTQVERFSPRTGAMFEVGHEQDVYALERIFDGASLFADREHEWGLRFRRELDKTNDSRLLIPRASLEKAGILDVGDDIREGHVRSRLLDAGYAPAWEGKNCRFESWPTQPILCVKVSDVPDGIGGVLPIGVRRIARNTDERTLIGCLVPPLTPTLYTIEVCRAMTLRHSLFVWGLMTSVTLDFVIRFQVASSVALSNLEALPLPSVGEGAIDRLSSEVSRLLAAKGDHKLPKRVSVEAVVAALYGLSRAHLTWMLRDCDHPLSVLADGASARRFDAKGFWRVDKDKDPELRLTVLTLIAFEDLQQRIAAAGGDRARGIASFCDQNDGEGWMLPQTLRLADYGLGHDERAQRPQPVRSRLGQPFYDWQLEQSVADSWAECERHARNLLGKETLARLQADLRGAVPAADIPQAAEARRPYGASQARLFPSERTLFGEAMEDPPTSAKRRKN